MQDSTERWPENATRKWPHLFQIHRLNLLESPVLAFPPINSDVGGRRSIARPRQGRKHAVVRT